VIASTFGGVHDFFSSGTWHVAVNLLIFFAIVLWLSVAYWVYKDAKRRIDDPVLVAVSVAVGLVLPYVGALVYMLFRPPEYLEDVRERELEIKAMEERLSRRDLYCPVCRAEVGSDFLVCPVCTTKLKQACLNPPAPVVHELQGAARGALAGLPVLRDAGRADSGRVPRVRGATAETQTALGVDSRARWPSSDHWY